ncbi:MAG: hypothetical protein KAI88_04450, partial [Nitrosomonadaceae bacterium]|nr:hypothetical protein [Nitrosomonadaceae bacterium]
MTLENDIRSEFQENYRYGSDYWAPFNKDAQVYTMAASGYTWSDNERKQLVKEGREPLELNIMRRPLQFFSGYLRDNINQIIYAPVEGSDQETADQFTKLSYHVWDKGQGYPTFLDASDEAFKSGISLCGIQMDYSKDFINGDISFYKRTYNSFTLDPTFESIDLKDCSFAITRDLVSKDYAKQLLPYVDQSEIDDIIGTFRDDKFMQFHPQFTTFSRNRDLIAYDQYYKRITKTRLFLVDLDNSDYRDITDLDKEEKDKLKVGLGRLEDMRNNAEIYGINRDEVPHMDIRSVERPFVELNILLNGKLVYQGDDKTGVNETFPFVPLICYMEPSIWMPSQRIQGLGSVNYSAQRQFNKRHMKIIDMMDSTISTGFKYLIGSVSDPQDLQQSGQNKLIGIDPDNAPQGLDSVQELNGGNASPSLMEYQQVLDQLTLTLSNVNESALGIDEKGNTQVSGRLAQVRIAQGLRGNRKIFDNIETAQQVLGGIILKAIQANYPEGKVRRIIAEEPTEQFYNDQFEQYDAVVKEGVRSQSQKDAYYYELVNLKREGIVDVPQSEIVKSLAMAGLSDLEEAIEVQEEEQKVQQEKIDEQERIGMELANSQKIANLSLSKEREACVLADIGLAQERSSEATSNLADAALARAKTMVELASMDEDRIFKVYSLMEQLHKEEKEL